MKKLLLLIALAVSASGFAAEKLRISSSVFQNSQLAFIEHAGSAPFASYLSMEVNFPPVAELFKDLLHLKRIQLANRGESHITVISPVEFDKVLGPAKVTMEEINQIAKKYNIQDSSFRVICLGMGEAKILDKMEKAFFIVVRSDDLLEIRREVKKLYLSKGGDAQLFDELKYYSHITLGFTKEDLHEKDHVYKNEASCHIDLEVF